MFVSVNQQICTGCGSCEEVCPNVFSVNDTDGVELLIDEIANIELSELVLDAAELCPENCIFVEE